MQGLYTDEGRWFDLLPKYLFLEPHLTGKRILEIDCGDGEGTSLLSRSAREIVALCASEEDLQNARKKAPELQKSFQKLIPGDLPFIDGTFDAVLAFRGAWSFGDLERLAREAYRLVKPSGFFCIASPNPGQQTLAEVLTQTSTPRSVGFYELQRRLRELFPEVHMVAQSPFFGCSMIDFSPDDPEAISLDPSLLEEGSEDASSFLALCGKLRLPRLDFSLIQLPLAEIYSLAKTRSFPKPSITTTKESSTELKRLKTQRSTLLRAKNEWEQKANEATQRLRRLSTKYREISKGSGNANKLEEQTARVQELETLLASTEETQKKLEAERHRLEMVALEHIGKVSEQKNEIHQKEERNVELRAKLVRLTTKIRKLEHQITEGRFTEKNLQTTLEKNEEAAREAEKRFRKAEEDTKERHQKLASLQDEKNSLQEKIDTLEKNQATYQNKLSQQTALEKKLQTLQKELTEAKAQVKIAQKKSQTHREQKEANETRLLSLQKELEETRAMIKRDNAKLADQEYRLAEFLAKRIEAEWRSEEWRQEAKLTQTLSSESNTFLEEIETRSAALARHATEEKERANQAERNTKNLQVAHESVQTQLKEIHHSFETLSSTRLDLENSLASAERRAATAKERALAAARDATKTRDRLLSLEEDLNKLHTQKEQLQQERDLAKQQILQLKKTLGGVNNNASETSVLSIRKALPPSQQNKHYTPKKLKFRMRYQNRKQNNLLQKISRKNVELSKALKQAKRAPTEPSFPTSPPPNAKQPHLHNNQAGNERETFQTLYQKTSSELAAAKAALEACRIARNEADKKRNEMEKKLADVLKQTEKNQQIKKSSAPEDPSFL